MALLHNHGMRNSHMCTLATTCSYRIYFWQRGGNQLQPSAAFV